MAFWHHDGENAVNSNKNTGRPFPRWYPSAVKPILLHFFLDVGALKSNVEAVLGSGPVGGEVRPGSEQRETTNKRN